ncbi:MAG: lipoate--protein ligase [Clostridia bacterium]|nr:lipoate--protein ligase [Clostridia bacterium]
MRIVRSNFHNPYFNLAMEEYVFNKFDGEVFMLWRNDQAIIVGKNQNTIEEINVDYVETNSIPVVRRMSGGGAVFHDLGNLNFTFISDDDGNSFSNFKRFTQPVVDLLQRLDVDAECSGRNDLTIDGKKFSGNAQFKSKKRVLHHGTLLFSSDIADISASLKPKASKFEGKSVKSVKSRVTNISAHLKQTMTIEEFMDALEAFMIEQADGFEKYELDAADIAAIDKMVAEKYSTWEWNYGKSPNYAFSREKRFEAGSVQVNLDVKNGIIHQAKFYGDFFGVMDVSEIENKLVEVKHEREALDAVLSQIEISNYFLNIDKDSILDLML